MRWVRVVPVVAFALVLLPAGLGASRLRERTSEPHRAPESVSRSPLHFEMNRGQTDARVRFLVRGRGYQAFVTPTETVFTAGADVLRMGFPGANPAPRVEGREPLSGKSHYLIGRDPEKWTTHVPWFGRVAVRGLWPGVDLRWYGGENGALRYDLVVAPGADPSVVALSFEGARSIRVDPAGNLRVRTGKGELRHSRPVLYQMVDGRRRRIEGGFVRAGRDGATIRVGPYDRRRPLVIDPAVAYSTYLGGSSGEGPWAVRVGPDGYAYVAGHTRSVDFPTKSPLQAQLAFDYDGFVSKIEADGSGLAWSTYLGGSSWDRVFALDVNDDGVAYATGHTGSKDFPIKSAWQGSLLGGMDAFVTKIEADGSGLVWSTYLGGTMGDEGNGIAVDVIGDVVVTGPTQSSDFPTRSALQGAYAGQGDGFVTRFKGDGSALVYSTYLGGSNLDVPNAIAVAADGAACVVGKTRSTDFPTKSALQSQKAGGVSDAFVTKIDAKGSLAWSTYLGGASSGVEGEGAKGVAVDEDGDVYVAGGTKSTGFPVKSPLQPKNAGAKDAFVSKIEADGSALVWSTYLGGSSGEWGRAVGVDGSGRVLVTGGTMSTDFPTVEPLQSTHGGGDTDAFVARIEADGSKLLFATYLGGSREDLGHGLAADEGPLVVAGSTFSTDFPTESPLQKSTAGPPDVFVWKLGFGPLRPTELQGEAVSIREIRLSWTDGSEDETGFEIQRARWGSFSRLATVGKDVTEFADLPLAAGTAYTYRVRAVNAKGASGWSNRVTVTTPEITEPPPAPEGLRATAFSDTRVVLAWVDHSFTEDGFEVLRKDGSGEFLPLGTFSSDTRMFKDDSVSGESAYTYRVRAFNAFGSSGFSGEASVTTPPVSPTALSGVVLSPSRIRISWSDRSSAEDGYCVERRVAGEVEYAPVVTLPADTTEHLDTTAIQEMVHEYQVRAFNANGQSNPAETGGLRTSAVFVIEKAKLSPAKGKKPARLALSGEFDTGILTLKPAQSSSLILNGQRIDISRFEVRKNGKVLRYEAEEIRLDLMPSSGGTSRVDCKLKVAGDVVSGLDPDGEITLTFESGGFRAIGSAELSRGRIQPEKGRGRWIDPALQVLSVSAKDAGGATMVVKLKARFATEGAAPVEMPDVVVALAGFEATFPGDSFIRKGDRLEFKESEGAKRRVVIDFRKGTFLFKSKRLDSPWGRPLSDLSEGRTLVPLRVRIGDVAFGDTPVMQKKESSLRY